MVQRKHLARLVFLGLGLALWGTVASADLAAIDFTSSTYEGHNNLCLGWKFTTNTAITVTSLGVFDWGKDGLSSSHEVGLWNESGTLLVSGTVNSGSGNTLVGWFRYTAVTPRDLAAGQSYRVGAVYGVADAFTSDPTGFTTDPNITYVDSRYEHDANLAFPIHTDTYQGYFGANFQFYVPEASTLTLLAVGLAGLGLLRLRRSRKP